MSTALVLGHKKNLLAAVAALRNEVSAVFGRANNRLLFCQVIVIS